MPPNAGWETALPNIRGLDGTIVPEDIVGGGGVQRTCRYRDRALMISAGPTLTHRGG